jgi:hypothetical protein
MGSMSIVPDEHMPLSERFYELGLLEDGWLDGEGRAPIGGVLEYAQRVLDDLTGLGLPRPGIFATPEGGVQMEWTLAEDEVSLALDPDDSAYAISVNLLSGRSEELHIESGDVEAVVGFLADKVEGS